MKKYRVNVAAVVIALSFLFSFWLMFHTFSYDPASQSMMIGQKLWSDFGQHIPVIRSFSHGANLSRLFGAGPVEFPLFPGEGMRYHYLFYAFVGMLEKSGIRIDWALNMPSAVGFAALLIGIYILAKYLFKNSFAAILSILFFLFNGSLAFLRFFTLHPLSLETIKNIRQLTEFPAFAPWGPGLVSAFWNLNIYTNQRHLAAAFAIVILFMLSLLTSEGKSFRKQVLAGLFWGIVFGFFPYFHQPSLLIVAVILVSYFILFPRLRHMLVVTGGVTAALAIPQILPLLGSGVKTFGWYPGYLIHDTLTIESFVAYWWQNLGLHALLIPLGLFFLPDRAKKAIFPLFIIFIGANLFKFSVEPAASHKFFNFVMILGSMISAYLIVQIFHRIKNPLRYVVSGVLILFLTLSGIIDFFVIFNDRPSPLADIQASEAARWIDENTRQDAIFLNSSYLYHPASLAGRSIFLGWPYFAWSAGYQEDRMPIMREMYESKNPRVYCPLFEKYGIDYVTVEDTHDDPNLPKIDGEYFFNSFIPEFKTEVYGIFSAEELCRDMPSMGS